MSHHSRQAVYLATVPRDWTIPPVILSAEIVVQRSHAMKGGDR